MTGAKLHKYRALNVKRMVFDTYKYYQREEEEKEEERKAQTNRKLVYTHEYQTQKKWVGTQKYKTQKKWLHKKEYLACLLAKTGT